MMSYLHTKFHENRISSFRGVAMTRFWYGRTDRRTDRRTDERSNCTPRPAFAFGDAGKNDRNVRNSNFYEKDGCYQLIVSKATTLTEY